MSVSKSFIHTLYCVFCQTPTKFYGHIPPDAEFVCDACASAGKGVLKPSEVEAVKRLIHDEYKTQKEKTKGKNK